MRSTLKTTAAVLRSITGLSDAHWADILGKSVHTIRRLEARGGDYELSPAMAAKMHQESGISIKWLMDGNPKAPPITVDGRRYTKEFYLAVRKRRKDLATVGDMNVKANALEFFRAILAVLVNANRQKDYFSALSRTFKTINELRAEFGEAKDFSTYEKALAYVQDVWQRKEPGLPLVPPPENARNIGEGLSKLAQTMRDNPTAFKQKSKQPSRKKKRH